MIQIGVGRAVERYHCGLIPRIVEVVQVVLAVGAVLIIIEINCVIVLNHVLQLAALAPSVRPSVVLQRITNRVIGDALAVERGQFILPVCVAVRMPKAPSIAADSYTAHADRH